MSNDFNSDIVDTAFDQFADLFQQTNNKKFLTALLQPLQFFSDTLQDVYNKRWVMTAEGIQLDNFGSIVGADRNGLSDFQYRLEILAKIAENNSRGQINDLISVFKLLSGATLIHVTEEYPASVLIVGDQNVNGFKDTDIKDVMQRVVGAGINVIGISFSGGVGSFAFAGGPLEAVHKGWTGVGSPAGTGGKFVGLV